MDDDDIYTGDCLDILKTFPDSSMDTMITDPPYGYAFMNKHWDKVVIGTDIWKECLRVLKPGSFAAIMSSPRQDVLARMIVNLQDAGFRTDYTSVYWTYATGFTKSTNVSKLVDKRAGVQRNKVQVRARFHENNTCYGLSTMPDKDTWLMDDETPITEKAKELDGAYCGFQPKPAVEIVLVVMKPSKKSYLDQAVTDGKGITWLSDCRIPFDGDIPKPEIGFLKSSFPHIDKEGGRPWLTKRIEQGLPVSDYKPSPKGRFPANLLVEEDVLNDGTVTKSKTGGYMAKAGTEFGQSSGWNKHQNKDHFRQLIHDQDSFSRYFSLDKWFETTFPFLITPKPSKSERNKGLDQWIDLKVNDGRKKEHDTPSAESLRKNTHTTVKPIKLMAWLVTLLSRPNDVVLDPFLGSGTTAIAAKLLKRRCVGIEKEQEYVDIAKSRIKAYATF